MGTDQNDMPEKNDSLRPEESLPPFVAYQVEEESRENVPTSSGVAGETYRRGRVEAETHRVSEEVTREAQERMHAAQTPTPSEAEAPATPAEKPTFPPETTLPSPKVMKHFLVPLDGTLQGERALPYAAPLAKLLGARILLGHVTPTEPPALLGQLFVTAASDKQLAQQAFAPEALPYLRQLRDWLATEKLVIETQHTTAPSVAEGLLEIEQAREIDLVLVALGVHGETDHMRVGRVADSLIRFGSAPVLVVPPEADAGSRPFELHHILVTLDGSTLAEQALGPLMGMLDQLHEHQSAVPIVTLLAVAEDYSILPDYQSYLDALRGTLAALPQFAQLQLHSKVVVGSAPGAIVGALEQGLRDDTPNDGISSPPVDLLIMTTHGRGGMTRWLLGSVADYVVPRVHVPVLLTRPAIPEAQQ